MKKKSSYQKQKDRIAELELDIYRLVRKPDSLEGQATLNHYRVRYDRQDSFMAGARSVLPKCADGIFPMMAKQKGGDQ
jgi:hypothetical protein